MSVEGAVIVPLTSWSAHSRTRGTGRGHENAAPALGAADTAFPWPHSHVWRQKKSSDVFLFDYLPALVSVIANAVHVPATVFKSLARSRLSGRAKHTLVSRN